MYLVNTLFTVYSYMVKLPKKSIKMYCHHQINKLLQLSFHLFTCDRQLIVPIITLITICEENREIFEMN